MANWSSVISPSGNEIGPFLSVEQASLSHIISDERRTDVFAWYNLAGSFSTAIGALAGGLLAEAGLHYGLIGAAAYRPVLLAYAGIGVALIAGFARLTPAIEPSVPENESSKRTVLGLHESKATVFKLSLLFALDAFGGGFVIQSVIAYWFHLRFQLDPASAAAGGVRLSWSSPHEAKQIVATKSLGPVIPGGRTAEDVGSPSLWRPGPDAN